MGSARGSGRQSLGAILAIYLTGLLIGGLYVGMVSPARTVVQADFGVDGSTGIWMINIYTLFYAALIPVVGKVADRCGRKGVFTACMGVFCAGALLCGLSQQAGGFALLLAGRVLQAAGAAGTIPVANAEIGATFPKEKRGTALAVAAVVAGVSNVFGAVLGSAVVDAFGLENWPVLFYLCVPFCLAVIIAATAFLPASARSADRGPMDFGGALVFALFVLALLLGVRGLDFTDPASSLAGPATWVPLAAAALLLPAFGRIERRAADPVFHLEYLRSRPIVATMAASFFIGCFVISMVMVPELVESVLALPLGTGGYYVLAIGLASFVLTPLAGKAIDKVGPKPVLVAGLSISIAGLLFLALYAVPNPSAAAFIAGLVVVGAGMGMSMGAPANYMILENTAPEDSSSAIATIALVRQVGTSLAPAVYIGLIGAAPDARGYAAMLLGVAAFNAFALVCMLLYRSPRR